MWIPYPKASRSAGTGSRVGIQLDARSIGAYSLFRLYKSCGYRISFRQFDVHVPRVTVVVENGWCYIIHSLNMPFPAPNLYREQGSVAVPVLVIPALVSVRTSTCRVSCATKRKRLHVVLIEVVSTGDEALSLIQVECICFLHVFVPIKSLYMRVAKHFALGAATALLHVVFDAANELGLRPHGHCAHIVDNTRCQNERKDRRLDH